MNDDNREKWEQQWEDDCRMLWRGLGKMMAPAWWEKPLLIFCIVLLVLDLYNFELCSKKAYMLKNGYNILSAKKTFYFKRTFSKTKIF